MAGFYILQAVEEVKFQFRAGFSPRRDRLLSESICWRVSIISVNLPADGRRIDRPRHPGRSQVGRAALFAGCGAGQFVALDSSAPPRFHCR